MCSAIACRSGAPLPELACALAANASQGGGGPILLEKPAANRLRLAGQNIAIAPSGN